MCVKHWCRDPEPPAEPRPSDVVPWSTERCDGLERDRERQQQTIEQQKRLVLKLEDDLGSMNSVAAICRGEGEVSAQGAQKTTHTGRPGKAVPRDKQERSSGDKCTDL